MNQIDAFEYFKLDPKKRKFLEYHRDNPHVYELFKEFALQIIKSGHKNFSARGIFHRIRWETYTDDRFEPLKVNNNYSSGYARLFEQDYPEHKGFFRKRKLTAETNQEVESA